MAANFHQFSRSKQPIVINPALSAGAPKSTTFSFLFWKKMYSELLFLHGENMVGNLIRISLALAHGRAKKWNLIEA